MQQHMEPRMFPKILLASFLTALALQGSSVGVQACGVGSSAAVSSPQSRTPLSLKQIAAIRREMARQAQISARQATIEMFAVVWEELNQSMMTAPMRAVPALAPALVAMDVMTVANVVTTFADALAVENAAQAAEAAAQAAEAAAQGSSR